MKPVWLLAEDGAAVQACHVAALVPRGSRVVALLSGGAELTLARCATEEEAKALAANTLRLLEEAQNAEVIRISGVSRDRKQLLRVVPGRGW